MSSCCAPRYRRVFGKRQAQRDARRFRRKGLDGTAQEIVDGLVGAASDRARRLLALSFPRDTWWIRLGWYAVDLWFRVVYRFASYVHPHELILGAAARAGFTPVREHSGRLWQVAVLERSIVAGVE